MAVAIHDQPLPTAHRRGMAFTDAIFSGAAVLDGGTARRLDDLGALAQSLSQRTLVPVAVLPFETLVREIDWDVLIDARMRKRTLPERQPRACAARHRARAQFRCR